ncbi:MAG: hypothetical protein FJ189_07290 [Gammaproteobacteria bacterium]|nr:hypothetical protein [Gammaproteobacteria bacterium]
MFIIILKDPPRLRPGSPSLRTHRLPATTPAATSSGSAAVSTAHPLLGWYSLLILGLFSAALFHLLLFFQLLPVAFLCSCLVLLLFMDALAFLLLVLCAPRSGFGQRGRCGNDQHDNDGKCSRHDESSVHESTLQLSAAPGSSVSVVNGARLDSSRIGLA